MSRYGYPAYSRGGYYIVDDYDSEEEEDMYEYEMYMRTLDEGICLTHVAGGCFEGGICDRLNYRIGQATCTDLGYSGDVHTRQLVRLAAGLPAGPAERPPPPGSRPAMGVPRWHGGDDGYGGNRQRRGGAASGGRAQQGGPSGPRRRPRGPDAYGEDDFGAEEQGPSGGVVYPDEVEEPDDGPVSGLGGAPQGRRRRAAADYGMSGRGPSPRTRGGPGMGMGGSRYGDGGSGEMGRTNGPRRGNRGPWEWHLGDVVGVARWFPEITRLRATMTETSGDLYIHYFDYFFSLGSASEN
ncbi:MAG: hypothetical protein Q9213_004557 [Squamulea squamosa]